MVLRNSGRVGSRRFTEESPVSDIGTGDLLFGDLMLDLNAETDMPSERELLRFIYLRTAFLLLNPAIRYCRLGLDIGEKRQKANISLCPKTISVQSVGD